MITEEGKNMLIDYMNNPNDEFPSVLNTERLTMESGIDEKKLKELLDQTSNKAILNEEMSTKGKISKLERQMVINDRQFDKDFTYEVYQNFIEENPSFANTSYYTEDLDTGEEVLYSEVYPTKLLKEVQKQYELAADLVHLGEHIKIPSLPVDTSRLKSTLNKTEKKLSKVSMIGLTSLGFKLREVVDTVNNLGSNTVPNKKFLYGLCKYIDKYYRQVPHTVVETLDILSYMKYGLEFKQNKNTFEQMNKIYEENF